MRFCQFVGIPRGGSSTRQPQHTEPCQCASGQRWAPHGVLQGQMQPLQCAAGVVEPVLDTVAGLGKLFVGFAVLPVCGDFQRKRHYSATTAQRALPVCEWPVMDMPWATAKSNAALTVCSRCGGACTGSCGQSGQVVFGGYGFAECWSFPDMEALLNNHSAQSPTSV